MVQTVIVTRVNFAVCFDFRNLNRQSERFSCEGASLVNYRW